MTAILLVGNYQNPVVQIKDQYDNITQLFAGSIGLNGNYGVDGSFTTVDGKTVTVYGGIITEIIATP